jgi:hypothetical protein
MTPRFAGLSIDLGIFLMEKSHRHVPYQDYRNNDGIMTDDGQNSSSSIGFSSPLQPSTEIALFTLS